MSEKSLHEILEDCHSRVSLALKDLAGGGISDDAAEGLRLNLEDVAKEIEKASMV